MNLCGASEIKALLTSHGFRFSKAMGQNFLINADIVERIARAAVPERGEVVLEVGPGIGCLTEKLAQRSERVISVELDRRLEPLLRETLAGYANIEMIFADFLKLDLESLARERTEKENLIFCANLPYNITSPALAKIVESKLFSEMTVMIQREAASRICADAGEADYGAFTIFINWYTRPYKLFDVPPDCFIPRPKVTSSVLRLTRRQSPPAAVCDESLFRRVVRAAFAQRRKTLVNALSAVFREVSKKDIQSVITGCGLLPVVRGEELDISAFAEVANRIKPYLS